MHLPSLDASWLILDHIVLAHDGMRCQLRDISCWHINYKHLSFLAYFPEAKTGELFCKRTFKVCNDVDSCGAFCLSFYSPQMSHKNMNFTQEHFQCNTTVHIQS